MTETEAQAAKGIRSVSIRAKLVAIIMATSGIALVIACGAYLAYQYYSSREAITGNLQNLARILGTQAIPSIGFDDPDSAREILASLSAESQIRAGGIYDRAGKLFGEFRQDVAEDEGLPKQPGPEGIRFEGEHLIIVQPILQEGARIGTVFLRSDLSRIESTLHQGIGISALVLAFSSLAALLLALKLGEVVTRPIQGLASTVKTVTLQNDYSLQAPPHGQDEVGQLIDGFNEMLSRIRTRDQALQQAHDELERRVEERTKDLKDEIIERRRAEEARRQADERLRIAMDAAHMGSWDWDVASDTGASMGEGPLSRQLKGGRVNRDLVVQLIHPDDRSRVTRYFDQIFERGVGDFHLEYRVVQPDGSYRWVYTSGRVYIGEDGRPTALTSVELDITDRKRTEEEIRKLNEDLRRRAAELEAAVGELEAFSYSVSHDLRAPIRAIGGFTRILEEEIGSAIEGPTKNTLARIKTATNRMGQLIDDLLTLSRITRTEIKRSPVDLSELSRSVIEDLRSREPERAVGVTVADGLLAEADPGLIRVTMHNLISNAWKFTSKVGDARIQVGTKLLNGMPAFYVKDNGAGFDMAYAGKLFNAFERLHRREEFDGTGIGLATVHRIVRRHGGKVWAEGATGRGATFYFTL